MEVFELIVDRKVEVWVRDFTKVKAESLDEAIDKCFKEDYESDSSEVIFGTELGSESYNGEPTIEIYDKDFKLLKDNGNQ